MQADLEVLVLQSFDQGLHCQLPDLGERDGRRHTHQLGGILEQGHQALDGLRIADPPQGFGRDGAHGPVPVPQGSDQRVHGALVLDQAQRLGRAFPDPPAFVAQGRSQAVNGRRADRHEVCHSPVPTLLNGVAQHRDQGLDHPRPADLRQRVARVHADGPVIVLQGLDQAIRRAWVGQLDEGLRGLFPCRIIRVRQRFQPVRQFVRHG